VDFSSSRNRGDKRRLHGTGDSLHLGKSSFKRRRHFSSRHIAGREHEFTHGILFKSTPLKKIVADSLVSGEQNPTLFTHEREPLFVGHTALKVIEMALALNSPLYQGFKDSARVTEIFVEV
jgi:hypothetical protein